MASAPLGSNSATSRTETVPKTIQASANKIHTGSQHQLVDPLESKNAHPSGEEISVADITRLYAFEKDDLKSLRRAIKVEALPQSWKGYFQHQLDKQIG